MKQIKQGRYRHFKGGICEVIGVGRHSETLEELVFYRHQDEAKGFAKQSLWARPKKMFFEKVMVKGKRVPRFRHLGDKKKC